MGHNIIITPAEALMDEKIEVILEGFEPGQQVTLKASMENTLGTTSKWSSQATFTAGEDGRIHVAKQAPINGSYSGAEPMGWLWSMKATKTPRPRKADSLAAASMFPAVTVKFSALVNGAEKATATCTRLHTAPGVAMRDVTDFNIRGRLFYTPDAGARPAIIVIGGIKGGIDYAQTVAALLASHGYTALALAYFGLEGLPPTLSNIPLEYFRIALSWLQEQPETLPEQVAIWGRSKGGELALLLGSRFRELKAVVAYNPSALSFQGLGKGLSLADSSSWTWLGKQIPHVKLQANMPLLRTQTTFNLTFKREVRFDKIYMDSIKGIKPGHSAFIPVERSNGPIMLVSAQDDAFWPSALFCNMITERLEQKGFKHKVSHFSYKDTGHLINPPYLPTTILQMNGGKVAENAIAAEDAWIKSLAFLKSNLSTQVTNRLRQVQASNSDLKERT